MSAHISNVRPKPDQVLVDIVDYVTKYKIKGDLAYETARNCLIDTLGCGFEALVVPGVHQAARADRPGHRRAERREGPGHAVPARPGPGGVQPRRDDPLARLQRHLARRRVGPPVRQPGRHPRHRRLAVAQRGGRGREAAGHARRAHRDDQGARDPGLHRAGELVQQGRPRPRRAGQGRLDRGGRADAGAHARRDRQRGVARVGRRPVAAHLPARAQHRLAQELGGRRRDLARRAPRADREDRRDGLSVGADREDLGLLRRAVQGQAVRASSVRTAAT